MESDFDRNWCGPDYALVPSPENLVGIGADPIFPLNSWIPPDIHTTAEAAGALLKSHDAAAQARIPAARQHRPDRRKINPKERSRDGEDDDEVADRGLHREQVRADEEAEHADPGGARDPGGE